MLKSSKDDDQMFMVFVGSRSCPEEKNEFGSVLVGVLATAIAMMMFVALIRDAEQQRLRNQGFPPIGYQQRLRPTSYPIDRSY
ncbi:MAG: hypothetical protein NW220_07480 [Leptolyngbyaceae cyanobacterium bins.349]|nr:hypothetical protein [Leptolyngbyaceae cyanobacterium bins.349]